MPETGLFRWWKRGVPPHWNNSFRTGEWGDTPPTGQIESDLVGKPMWQLEGAVAAEYRPAPTDAGPQDVRPGRLAE